MTVYDLPQIESITKKDADQRVSSVVNRQVFNACFMTSARTGEIICECFKAARHGTGQDSAAVRACLERLGVECVSDDKPFEWAYAVSITQFPDITDDKCQSFPLDKVYQKVAELLASSADWDQPRHFKMAVHFSATGSAAKKFSSLLHDVAMYKSKIESRRAKVKVLGWMLKEALGTYATLLHIPSADIAELRSAFLWPALVQGSKIYSYMPVLKSLDEALAGEDKGAHALLVKYAKFFDEYSESDKIKHRDLAVGEIVERFVVDRRTEQGASASMRVFEEALESAKKSLGLVVKKFGAVLELAEVRVLEAERALELADFEAGLHAGALQFSDASALRERAIASVKPVWACECYAKAAWKAVRGKGAVGDAEWGRLPKDVAKWVAGMV